MHVPAEPKPEARRLLALVTDYMLEHGVGATTLSGMARAIGSNNRMLLYYFGSKEALLGLAMVEAYGRFPSLSGLMAGLREGEDIEERLRWGWRKIADEENRPFLRLLFELYGVAARMPQRHREFFEQVSREWPPELAAVLRQRGFDAGRAESLAVQILALWRGLQLALLAGEPPATLAHAHDSAVAALLSGARD
ncbi:TetR/AcrR family transcriptional regulator [Naasia sp. SYSU D00948]|uniref:TetR/AcrR family transcriptional regulator n=1 Tax=Naasia sp. SYSU D00948 TaxID=2817379 RepID=UPI001B30EAB5|nr:TetR/AcrR family transcriptional regulator [Naasia sp. SYSU D00948]